MIRLMSCRNCEEPGALCPWHSASLFPLGWEAAVFPRKESDFTEHLLYTKYVLGTFTYFTYALISLKQQCSWSICYYPHFTDEETSLGRVWNWLDEGRLLERDKAGLKSSATPPKSTLPAEECTPQPGFPSPLPSPDRLGSQRQSWETCTVQLLCFANNNSEKLSLDFHSSPIQYTKQLMPGHVPLKNSA